MRHMRSGGAPTRTTSLDGAIQGECEIAQHADAKLLAPAYDRQQAAFFLEQRLIAYVHEIDSGRYPFTERNQTALWRDRLMRIIRLGTGNASFNDVAFVIPAFESWRDATLPCAQPQAHRRALGVS